MSLETTLELMDHPLKRCNARIFIIENALQHLAGKQSTPYVTLAQGNTSVLELQLPLTLQFTFSQETNTKALNCLNEAVYSLVQRRYDELPLYPHEKRAHPLVALPRKFGTSELSCYRLLIQTLDLDATLLTLRELSKKFQYHHFDSSPPKLRNTQGGYKRDTRPPMK